MPGLGTRLGSGWEHWGRVCFVGCVCAGWGGSAWRAGEYRELGNTSGDQRLHLFFKKNGCSSSKQFFFAFPHASPDLGWIHRIQLVPVAAPWQPAQLLRSHPKCLLGATAGVTRSCVGARALLAPPPDPQGSMCASPWQSLSPDVPGGATALPLPASARPHCQRAVSQPRCSLGLVLARGDELERFIGVTHTLPRCSPHVLTLLAVLQGGGSALRCR